MRDFSQLQRRLVPAWRLSRPPGGMEHVRGHLAVVQSRRFGAPHSGEALGGQAVTGQLSTFALGAKVIHADIDPAEISKNRVADVPIVGDCSDVLTDLIAAVGAEQEAGRGGDYAAWREQVNAN